MMSCSALFRHWAAYSRFDESVSVKEIEIAIIDRRRL